MKKITYIKEANIVINLKNLDIEGYIGPKALSRTRNRIIAGIRSNEGLDIAEIGHFIIRHTNKDVYLAFFKLDREAEKTVRVYVSE